MERHLKSELLLVHVSTLTLQRDSSLTSHNGETHIVNGKTQHQVFMSVFN